MKKNLIFEFLTFSFLFLVLISIFVALVSCNEQKSDPLTEKAEVIQLVYLPDTQRTSLAPGFSGSGNVTFTVVSSGHEEYWGVVLRCSDHNKTFTLSGKTIYERVKVGQIVNLKYIEIFRIEDGEKKVLDYKTIELLLE